MLTIQQVADKLEVHPNTVRSLRKRGLLTANKFSKRLVLFTDDAVEALLKNTKEKHGGAAIGRCTGFNRKAVA